MKTDGGEGIDSVTIRFAGRSVEWRNYFSQTHMRSAAFQARRALAIEQAPFRTEDITLTEYTACVIGAVLAATAAMDAAVSEVFVTAREKNEREQSPIDRNLAVLWRVLEGSRMREKVRVALECVGKGLQDMRSWKNTDDLIKLRNLLTHYTGGSVVVESDITGVPVAGPSELEKALRSKGIGRTYLDSRPTFPFTYLSGNCAAWAVASSREFIDEFCASMQHESPFDLVENYENQAGRPSPFIVVAPVRAKQQGGHDE
jgi:hypothetical protein